MTHGQKKARLSQMVIIKSLCVGFGCSFVQCSAIPPLAASGPVVAHGDAALAVALVGGVAPLGRLEVGALLLAATCQVWNKFLQLAAPHADDGLLLP